MRPPSLRSGGFHSSPPTHPFDIARELALAIVASQRAEEAGRGEGAGVGGDVERGEASTMFARGESACIYSPPLRCANGLLLGDDEEYPLVSKLTVMDDEYRTEVDVLRLLERVDPEHRFHVRYVGSCEAGEGEGTDCELEDMEEDERRGLIVMERAPRMLHPSATFPRDPEVLLPALKNLWAGLRLLAENGYGYNDLFPKNVAVGEDGLFRMIDFGACEETGEPAEALAISARQMGNFVEDEFGDSEAAVAWSEQNVAPYRPTRRI